MSHAALDDLSSAQVRLERALGTENTSKIDEACEQFRVAVFAVRASGGWHGRPELARQAADLLGRVETTQQRVKNLTRETRERLATIDALRRPPALRLYDRAGQSPA